MSGRCIHVVKVGLCSDKFCARIMGILLEIDCFGTFLLRERFRATEL
ncbi:MAG: hypothetical protein JWM68_4404 [Verrucomicrobiales bacterium]|nr:hypothetical protein [Verrucomicrobiales bacterium]